MQNVVTLYKEIRRKKQINPNWIKSKVCVYLMDDYSTVGVVMFFSNYIY